MSAEKVVAFVLLWSREYPVTTAAKEADCSHKMAIDIYLWLREVFSVSLCNTTIKLGGPNVIVQIDESQFSQKPKV